MTERSSAVSGFLACAFVVALVVPAAAATPVDTPLRQASSSDDVTVGSYGLPLEFGDDLPDRERDIVLGVVAMSIAAVATVLVYRYRLRFAGVRGTSTEDANASASSDSEPVVERPSGSAIDRNRSEQSTPLSDSERVIRLLEDNDGQLRQSEIVSQTPWSKSKVSRLLTRMNDHQQIVKINAGRQNVIVLPEAEPEELKSIEDRER